MCLTGYTDIEGRCFQCWDVLRVGYMASQWIWLMSLILIVEPADAMVMVYGDW